MILKDIKRDFPIFEKHPNLVYLDSCATTLKIRQVIDKTNEYYADYGVNVHRGVYDLSYHATQEYEKTRAIVASFINARTKEIVYTKGTTQGLNLVASKIGELLEAGSEILVNELEHHSSLLPWQQIAKKKNFKLQFIPLTDEGRISLANFKKTITPQTRVLAITYVSNVLGYITPLKEIIAEAHRHNIIVIVDAAQAAPHIKIDVKELDCDFLAFSAHKMLGPTGFGILYGKSKWLNAIEPLEYGGDMNDDVDYYEAKFREIPYKFEAGTQAIAEAIAFKEAIKYIETIGIDNIHNHELRLVRYAIEQLLTIDGVDVYNKLTDTGIIAFNIKGVHPHDVASFLDQAGIALRAGHHCAQLVSRWLKCNGTLRASFYIYNTKEDVDRFIQAVKEAKDFFGGF